MKWSDHDPRPGAGAIVAIVMIMAFVGILAACVPLARGETTFTATQTGVNTVQFCTSVPGNLFAVSGAGVWWYDAIPAGCTDLELIDGRWNPYAGRVYAIEINGVWTYAAPLPVYFAYTLYFPIGAAS